MTIQPVEMATITANQLHANNILCHFKEQLSTQINKQPATIQIKPLGHKPSIDIMLVLSIDGLDTPVYTSRNFFSDLKIGESHIDQIIDQLPETLLLGSMHFLFERLLHDTQTLLQKEIKLKAVHFSIENQTHTFISFTVQRNGIDYSGLIGLTDQHLEWLKAHIPPPNDAIVDIPILYTLEAGRTQIDASALNHLQKGDVILLEQSWYHDKKSLFLKIAHDTGFIVHLNDNTITLTQPMEVPPMSSQEDKEQDDLKTSEDNTPETLDETTPPQETNPAAAQSAQSTNVGAIPVVLTFEVGK